MNEIIRTELLPGTTLCGGKYVIEKNIGAGGFGITYIATHSTLDKRYAIKEFFLSGYNVRNNTTNHISLQGIENEDFEKFRLRFIEEARTLAALNNDSVVKVVDIFDENGTSYMVMPFVEGVTLQKMVENNGPMDYEIAVNYIVQIAEALSYIHSKNILHRDVTPDNIIVTPSQRIVLIDFGSARKFIENKTQRHTTIVKKGFAPIEQYSATSRKGAFTDLYSLGAVFYYILTGERPMDATERLNEKMKEPIEIHPTIPEQINAIVMKAMEMDSANRYQTATEMTDDIFSGKFPKRKVKASKIALYVISFLLLVGVIVALKPLKQVISQRSEENKAIAALRACEKLQNSAYVLLAEVEELRNEHSAMQTFQQEIDCLNDAEHLLRKAESTYRVYGQTNYKALFKDFSLKNEKDIKRLEEKKDSMFRDWKECSVGNYKIYTDISGVDKLSDQEMKKILLQYIEMALVINPHDEELNKIKLTLINEQ